MSGAPGLRGGDALHLAIASEQGAVVQTIDQRLAEAGTAGQRTDWTIEPVEMAMVFDGMPTLGLMR